MSWEENIRKVIPYTPGEQPKIENIIKLNTNECPYPPAPEIKEKLEKFSYESLRLYPDPSASVLVNALSSYYNITPEKIFVGVGSDDVLAMAFLTFFNSNKPILFPDITYSFYDVWAELFKIPYKKVPLNDDFEITIEDYFEENGGVIFPNPNAPTGLFMDLSKVEEIIKKNKDSVVIVDEAYIDFGGISAASLIDKYDNLLVVQTFSKSRAMAGMRIGYAFGSKKLIKYLQDAKFSFNSYTMNRTSLEFGVASLENVVYFQETCGKIISTRERVKKDLKNLGFTFPDSMSNFIFARNPEVPAVELFDALKKQGIFVRYFNAPRIDDYLRITIGTDKQMDIFMDFLKKYLQERL